MKHRTITLDDHQERTPFFLAVGDLMAALLLIFALLLSGTLLRLQRQYGHKVEMTDTYKRRSEQYWEMSEEYRSISLAYEELAETYRQLQHNLYQDLYEEFNDDLKRWGTNIDPKTAVVRFQEPAIFFGQGEDRVPDGLKRILDSFFPRYVDVLRSANFRDQIEEIRIEGHTSSEWHTDVDADTAYFKNMQLSQNRTRNVLQYCLGCLNDRAVREWVRGKITANGLSSSKLIITNGVEDKAASRRVEFSVRTCAEDRIGQILRLADERRDNTQ